MHQHPPGVVSTPTDVYCHVFPLDDPWTVHPGRGGGYALCYSTQRSHSKEDARIAGISYLQLVSVVCSACLELYIGQYIDVLTVADH